MLMRPASLFATTTVGLATANVASLFYDARYATPLYGPLAAGAALGLDRLLREKRATGVEPATFGLGSRRSAN